MNDGLPFDLRSAIDAHLATLTPPVECCGYEEVARKAFGAMGILDDDGMLTVIDEYAWEALFVGRFGHDSATDGGCGCLGCVQSAVILAVLYDHMVHSGELSLLPVPPV